MPAIVLRPTPGDISVAARFLREGHLVAFPTETVYGLGADAVSDAAVAEIFAVKGRPSFNPLIIHLPHEYPAGRLAEMDERAKELGKFFWPGPLTLVLRRNADCPISLLASAGLDTVALRMPSHPVARELLHAFGRPIAAPSANPSGRLSPTTAVHVVEWLGERVTAIIDSGPTSIGLESTIVDLSRPVARLLRPGGLAAEDIESVIGPLAGARASEAPSAPGMLESHYAPDLPLRLDAFEAKAGEALLAFGPDGPEAVGASLNLSPTGDLTEAAAHLFAYLRRLDASKARAIAVMPIPERGLGRAINDRLRRAAAPRLRRI